MYLQLTREEIKPSLYLQTLTNEELLRYAEPVTDLEKELVKRLECDNANNCDDMDEAYNEVRILKAQVNDLEKALTAGQDDYYDLLLKCASLENELEDLQEKLDVFIPQ